MIASARVALRSESGRPSDDCAVGAMDAVQLEMAGGWGGSFDDVSSHEMTRPPSPAILPCRARAVNPVRALTRDPAKSSATASIVPSDRVMHHRAAWRGVPLRRSDTRGLAGTIRSSFLPAFLARRRSWDVSGPSQVCSRIRVKRHFCGLGPTCRFHRAFAPICFRRARFTKPCASARRRLLGFAPVCDPIPGSVADRSILPWALPLAGLRTRRCACDWARPQPHHQPPGSRAPLSRTARPYPLVGFAECIPRALQRIDGADTLAGLNDLREPLVRPVNLFEVLHRP